MSVLFEWPRGPRKARDGEWHELPSDEESVKEKTKEVPKRLGVEEMIRHYNAKGSKGTFLRKSCNIGLCDGRRAIMAYVMPKYSTS